MGINDPKSLQYAKYQVLNSILDKGGFDFGAILYSSKEYPQSTDSLKLILKKFNGILTTGVHHAALKYKDANSRLHFFTINFPTAFYVESSEYHYRKTYCLNVLSKCWSSIVFDKMCEMSDAGIELLATIRDPKNKKSIHQMTVMAPYEGSKHQIAADMLAPDFAYMDEPIVVPF